MSSSASRPTLSASRVEAMVASTLTSRRAPRIGAEVEWLVFDATDLARPVSASESAEAVASVSLPAGGTVSIEPGGQVELSTRAFGDPGSLCDAIAADTDALVRSLRRRGLVMVSFGLDPIRPPQPTLDAPRYRAMAAHFAACSPAGLTMMASTAAFQISVDPGPVQLRSWRVLSALAPVLNAAFANSDPLGTGSARQRVWSETERCRTAPVPTRSVDDWVSYVLDATVMLPSALHSTRVSAPRETFRDWLDADRSGPTAGDLVMHLSTLFPPVRPRGHLEVRSIDALPPVGRAAALGTVWALVTDPAGAERAVRACPMPDRAWDLASTTGDASRALDGPVNECLAAAAASLDSTAPELAHACRSWHEQREERLTGRDAARSASVRPVEDVLFDLVEGNAGVAAR